MGVLGQKKTGGRKAGTRNKKTAELLAQVEATGKQPLEVMLGNMRWAADMVDSLGSIPQATNYRKLAQEWAVDAAPYVHARLAQTTVGGEDGGPIVHRIEVEFVGSDHAKD